MVRPDGPTRTDPNVLLRHGRRLAARRCCSRPSGEWLRVILGQRRARAARSGPGRDLRQRAGPHQRLRRRARPPGARARSRWPARRSPSTRRPRCAIARARRSVRTPTRCSASGEPRRATAAARRPRDRASRSRACKVVDVGDVPRRSARTDAAGRPRCRRGEGRAAAAARAMRWVEWSFFGCQRGKRGVALDLKSPAGTTRARRAARDGPTSSTTTCGCPAARRLGLDEAVGAGGQPRHRLLPRQLVRPAGAAGRLARLRPAVPGVVRLGGRRRRRGQPADVAPLRLHGPPLRDGLVDRHAARARTTATAPATTQVVAGSLLAGGVLTGSETYLDADGEIVADRRCSTTSRPASRPASASPSVTDGWIAIAATTDDGRGAVHRGRRRRPRRRAGAGRTHRRRRARRARATQACRATQVRLDQGDPFFASADNDAAGTDRALSAHRLRPGRAAGRVLVVRRPRREARPRAPALGEHTVEVLTEVGLDAATVDALVASGAAHAWKAAAPA